MYSTFDVIHVNTGSLEQRFSVSKHRWKETGYGPIVNCDEQFPMRRFSTARWLMDPIHCGSLIQSSLGELKHVLCYCLRPPGTLGFFFDKYFSSVVFGHSLNMSDKERIIEC